MTGHGTRPCRKKSSVHLVNRAFSCFSHIILLQIFSASKGVMLEVCGRTTCCRGLEQTCALAQPPREQSCRCCPLGLLVGCRDLAKDSTSSSQKSILVHRRHDAVELERMLRTSVQHTKNGRCGPAVPSTAQVIAHFSMLTMSLPYALGCLIRSDAIVLVSSLQKFRLASRTLRRQAVAQVDLETDG